MPTLTDEFNMLIDDYEDMRSLALLALHEAEETKAALTAKLEAVTKELNEARRTISVQSKAHKRQKAKEKRQSEKKAMGPGKLKKLLEDHQKALRYAAIPIGRLDQGDIEWTVFDNRTQSLNVDGRDVLARELLLLNSYGAARAVYYYNGKMHQPKIPPKGQFRLNKELKDYCANWFKVLGEGDEKA